MDNGAEAEKPVGAEDAKVMVTGTELELEIVDEDGRYSEDEERTSSNNCSGDGA